VAGVTELRVSLAFGNDTKVAVSNGGDCIRLARHWEAVRVTAECSEPERRATGEAHKET